MNYGNRNASAEYTMKDLMLGYSAAVASSVSMGVGLQKVFKPVTSKLKGGKFVLANALISYCAVATAGFLNSLCMRMGELERGIVINDD